MTDKLTAAGIEVPWPLTIYRRLTYMDASPELRDEGYPAGFRVLCHNCNCALAYYGRCPHQGREDA